MHQQLAARARDVITRTLIQLGCTQIGFIDDVENHALILGFKHRGRRYNLTASAKGWAQKYLKDKPWTYARRKTRHDYEQDALRKGYIAINSILRDCIKGQVMAIECGILSFEAVFMPHMLMADGRRMIEHLAESNLLPPPEEARFPIAVCL